MDALSQMFVLHGYEHRVAEVYVLILFPSFPSLSTEPCPSRTLLHLTPSTNHAFQGLLMFIQPRVLSFMKHRMFASEVLATSSHVCYVYV